jgi:hypothetical protein
VTIEQADAVAVPGDVVEAEVIETAPGDILVRLRLHTDAVVEVALKTVYDPQSSSVDVVDAYSFLLMQNTPPTELQRALDAFDPRWEAKVQERKQKNGAGGGSA